MLYDLIVFLPLIGFLISGLFRHQLGPRNAEYVTTGLLAVSCFSPGSPSSSSPSAATPKR